MTALSSATASLTPRRVPEAYIRAEVASFPLTGFRAFEDALVDLDPTLEARPTQRLWRACEEKLAQNGAGWSLDRIVGVRDRTWFSNDGAGLANRSPIPIPMHEYLRQLARGHLQRRPGTTGVEQSSDASAIEATAHYRWLTFALPEDLLLSAVDFEPPPHRVGIDPPLLLRCLLDRGVAEIHLHVGAGMDYGLLWAAAMAALASPSLKRSALAGPGAPFGDGEGLVQWLLAAAIARVVLAEYLVSRDVHADAPSSLREFLERLAGRAGWSMPRRRVLFEALRALEQGRWREDGEQWFLTLRDLYAELHPTGVELAAERPTTLDQVWRRCDPIAVRLDLTRPGAGERFLVAHSLAYLASEHGRSDRLFARIFWQALRVRCQHYQAVVQRPMTAGLQWFIRFYARIGALRDPLRSVRAEAAYWTAGGGEAIAALEMRTSIEDTPTEVAAELLGFVDSWQNVLDRLATQERPPEVGILFHFVKRRDPDARSEKGMPQAFWMGTHAEPVTCERSGGVFSSRERYVGFLGSRARGARALVELLHAVPEALWLVRGLDVANDELAIPTWVMVPLYRYVLEQADCASMRCPPDGPPSIRITAHVGEDYRHLMEGLRRVYECVGYLLLDTRGGRLGHATALGVEPRLWAESVGAVILPAEERLMDLVFEWRLYSRYHVRSEFGAAAPPARAEQVANLIRELSEQIFGTSHEPEHMAELHHVLHRFLVPPRYPLPADGGFDTFRRAAQRLLGPSGRRNPLHFPQQVGALLEGYLEDEGVFRRGQALIDVAIDSSELAALGAVQQALRCGVAANGVVVEVNPSSNLLIGDMLDLRNHPMLRLYPIEPDERLTPVSIAVGSDDPVTFSTSLLREYTLLYEAARAAGYPDRVALEWLETVRRTSMDSRFTLAWRPSARKRAELLSDALKTYLQRPRYLP